MVSTTPPSVVMDATHVGPEQDDGTLRSPSPQDGGKGGDLEKHSSEDPDGSPAAAAATAGSAPPDFVEGGLKGYLNVLGAFLTLFITFGYTNGFGVLQDFYKQNQYSNQSASNIAWVGSIQLWCMFTMSIPSGILYDKGYFRYLVGGGSAFYVLNLFMVSLCKEFWQTILAQGFGMGIGMGLMFLPAISVLSQNWKRRRAFAMGTAVSGSSIGGVVFPIFLNKMLARKSFGDSIRATAYLVLACAIIINLVMSAQPPAPKPAGAPKPQPHMFFAEPRYGLATSGAFFVALGLFVPLFYIQVFLQIKGVDSNITYYSLAILNAASVFGRTIPNAIADKVGPFNVMVPICACAGAIVFLMFAAGTSAGAVIFCLLYGFFSGAYVSMVGPIFASTATHFSEIGIRMGMPFIFIGLAALVGSPIAGQLLNKTPTTFLAPIIFAGCTMLLGSSLLFMARREQAIVKGMWRV